MSELNSLEMNGKKYDSFVDLTARAALEEGNYYVYYQGNIIPMDMVAGKYTKNGVTITQKNGVFVFNGTCTGGASLEILPVGVEYARLKPNMKYQLTATHISGSTTAETLTVLIKAGDEWISQSDLLGGVFPLSYPEEKVLTRFALGLDGGKTYDNLTVAPYLGLQYTESYAGGVLKMKPSVDMDLLKKNVDELVSEVKPVSEMYANECDRITPIVQGMDADLRLVVFTDPHSFDVQKYKKYNNLMRTGCLDGLVGLGDYQVYSETEKAYTVANLTKMMSNAGRMPNCFYAVGNHDIAFRSANSGEVTQDNVLTEKEMYDCLSRHLNGAAHYNDADLYGGYYYVEYDAAKIRMIVLNTSDIYEADGTLQYKYAESVMMQQPQVTWFVEKALDFSDKSNPNDWSILVCMHAYFDAVQGMISSILSAAKSGTAVNASWTFNRRIFSDGSINTTNPVAISANKDFSTQGAVDVIGVLYGHDHINTKSTQNGINFVDFICDNAELDNFYVKSVSGLSAGSYCFTVNEAKFGFTLAENMPDAAVIGYNAYGIYTGVSAARIQDVNGHTIANIRATTAEYVSGMTELDGFTQERTPDTVKTESCSVVSINKDTRKISIVPYGTGVYREIEY